MHHMFIDDSKWIPLTVFSRKQITPSNILLFHLSAVESLLCIVFLLFSVPFYFREDAYVAVSTICGFHGFLLTLLHPVALWTVCGLNCDRYYAISAPLHYNAIVNSRKVRKASEELSVRKKKSIFHCFIRRSFVVWHLVGLWPFWPRYRHSSMWQLMDSMWLLAFVRHNLTRLDHYGMPLHSPSWHWSFLVSLSSCATLKWVE